VNDLPIAAPTERMPMAGNLPVIARVDARRNTQVSDIQWTETGDAPLEGALDQQAARHAIDARRPGARTEPPEPARLLKTLVNDDQLRAERLAELLRQAAEAARGGG
jgi:hypothetical protein